MDLIKLIRPACLAVSLLALSASPGLAQEDASVKTTRALPAGGKITVDFPGGPLSKLVLMLRTIPDTSWSIIQLPDADPILPAFSVRNAPIESVMQALDQILKAQGYNLTSTGPGVAVVTRARPERTPTQAFTSLQLEFKIGPRTAEDVITAIQQGCEFANEGRASTLRFKYHPATKLLFVAGTEREVDIAYRVFGSLPNVDQELNASEKQLARVIPPEKNPPDKK